MHVGHFKKRTSLLTALQKKKKERHLSRALPQKRRGLEFKANVSVLIFGQENCYVSFFPQTMARAIFPQILGRLDWGKHQPFAGGKMDTAIYKPY